MGGLLAIIGTKNFKSEPQNTQSLPKVIFKNDEILRIEGIDLDKPVKDLIAWVNKEDAFLSGRHLIYGKIKVNIVLEEKFQETIANIELLSIKESFQVKANHSLFSKKIRFVA